MTCKHRDSSVAEVWKCGSRSLDFLIFYTAVAKLFVYCCGDDECQYDTYVRAIFEETMFFL